MILDEQHTFVNNRGLPIISICEHLVGIKIKTDKRKYRRLKLESIRLFGTPTNLNISAWLYTLVLHFSVYTWKKRDNVPVSLTDTTTNNEPPIFFVFIWFRLFYRFYPSLRSCLLRNNMGMKSLLTNGGNMGSGTTNWVTIITPIDKMAVAFRYIPFVCILSEKIRVDRKI
jgi:hypothetical protein